jgi:hypothetical protein
LLQFFSWFVYVEQPSANHALLAQSAPARARGQIESNLSAVIGSRLGISNGGANQNTPPRKTQFRLILQWFYCE